MAARLRDQTRTADTAAVSVHADAPLRAPLSAVCLSASASPTRRAPTRAPADPNGTEVGTELLHALCVTVSVSLCPSRHSARGVSRVDTFFFEGSVFTRAHTYHGYHRHAQGAHLGGNARQTHGARRCRWSGTRRRLEGPRCSIGCTPQIDQKYPMGARV